MQAIALNWMMRWMYAKCKQRLRDGTNPPFTNMSISIYPRFFCYIYDKDRLEAEAEHIEMPEGVFDLLLEWDTGDEESDIETVANTPRSVEGEDEEDLSDEDEDLPDEDEDLPNEDEDLPDEDLFKSESEFWSPSSSSSMDDDQSDNES